MNTFLWRKNPNVHYHHLKCFALRTVPGVEHDLSWLVWWVEGDLKVRDPRMCDVELYNNLIERDGSNNQYDTDSKLFLKKQEELCTKAQEWPVVNAVSKT